MIWVTEFVSSETLSISSFVTLYFITLFYPLRTRRLCPIWTRRLYPIWTRRLCPICFKFCNPIFYNSFLSPSDKNWTRIGQELDKKALSVRAGSIYIGVTSCKSPSILIRLIVFSKTPVRL